MNMARSTILNDKQQESLEKMRSEFSEVPKECCGLSVNDSTLLRYLRARSFDVDKAVAMLRATIEWRNSFGLSDFYDGRWEDVLSVENSTGRLLDVISLAIFHFKYIYKGKLYVRGFDRDGRALLYLKPRFENTNKHADNMKHLVFNLEKAVSCMSARNEGVEKICLVLDFEGFSLLNMPPMKSSLETLSILQNHYPERLHKAYVIRPPWIFSVRDFKFP